MQQFNTLDTPGPIDFDNLNIIIRPHPPRRRSSGTSIIPFRPYVKRLTSVRQEFSFANGRDKWSIMGREEPFFKQENARCIGSLMDDCGISEVIRWDIEGESTRLPMMCKLWMIVDGAVVERGKPHLVQDAAVQVFVAGRSLASILAAERRYSQTTTQRYDRRRRHSWHDVNEYHSVPYFQYTRTVRSGCVVDIQCDLDNEHSTGTQEYLPFIEEETIHEHRLENMKKDYAQETIHYVEIPGDRCEILETKESESRFRSRSTSIDSGILLSSRSERNRQHSASQSRDISVGTRDDFEYLHQSIATGDDTEYSNQSVSTRDHIEYSSQSVATQDDIEYSNQSISTRDYIEYSDRSVATQDGIKYSHQSVATHDDIEYMNQSVSTRDDIEYSDQSVATQDGIKYSNQSVATHDDIEYANQSVSTRDDIEFLNQSVSTRDDMEHSYHSIATGNDIEYMNQSVSTRDDIGYSHQSVSTHDHVGYSNQSVATRDDIEYSDRSVATRDDMEHSHHSIATGSNIEYLNQSVATRDDIGFLNQSVSTHDDIEYSNRSIATGDDYPDFWLQFSTNELLSNQIIKKNERQGRTLSLPSPRQLDQSIQTETEQDADDELARQRASSARSSHILKSPSSATISTQYEVSDQVDDESHQRRSTSHRERLDSHGDLDSRSSDCQLDTSSNRDSSRQRRPTFSSRQSDLGYSSFQSPLNHQLYSTPDLDTTSVHSRHAPKVTNRTIQTTNTENPYPSVFEMLYERYEKTLRASQQDIAILNDKLLDIYDILKHYRERIRDPVTTQSDQAIQLPRDVTSTLTKSKEERPSSPISSTVSTRIGYPFISTMSTEDILQDYIPTSRIYMTDSSLLNSSRQTRSSSNHTYCDLCLTDHSSGSAWIRYNEQRIDQLQQRMNLMLESNENEDNHLTLSTLNPLGSITTQRIDDILSGRSRRRNQLSNSRDRTSPPRRSNLRLPSRFHSMAPSSPRISPRNATRSISPASKRVRISTKHVLIPNQTRRHEPISSTLSSTTSSSSVSRPIVSILRRNNTNITTNSPRLKRRPCIWPVDVDRNMNMLELYSIPRYYRLYNDVGFREVYDFSRILDLYMNRISSREYTSMIQDFALDQQLPPSITTVA